MPELQEIKLIATMADTSGTTSVTAAAPALGLLYAVQWIDGTLADGVDATLVCKYTDSDVDQTLLTLTNANADAWYYPRTQIDSETGTGLTYNGTQTVTDMLVLNGTLKLTVTSGGAGGTESGGCIVYYLR